MSDVLDPATGIMASGIAPALGAASAPRRRLVRDLVLYGLCSAAALAVDWATLTSLVWHGVSAPAAAAVGFSLGMAVTYLSSITLVYADRRKGSPWREAAVFMIIGIAGLGLNELLLYAFATALGLSAPIAKAPTAGFVFLFNFAVRRAMLFAA